MANSFLFLLLHLLVLSACSRYTLTRYNFYSLFYEMAQNKLLHFLHTTFVIHFLFLYSFSFAFFTLGKPNSSEQSILHDNFYKLFSDLILLVSFFPSELDMSNLIYFAFLFAVKSFVWIYEIKSQRHASYRMLMGGALLMLFSIICAYLSLAGFAMRFSLNILLSLEYSLVVISLCKSLLLMLINLYEIESMRSFYVFIISISNLVLKLLIYSVFISLITLIYKFPFNIARSFLSTAVKLKKKLELFRDYLQLVKDLESIEEIEINGSCAICTDNLEWGKALKCTHAFHAQCLKMWCEREMTCPICRAPLTFKQNEEILSGDEILSGIPVELTG